MNSKRSTKRGYFCTILLVVLMMIIFVSCSKEDAPKSNIEADTAWQIVESGFLKTSTATGYDITFKTRSKAVFGEHSSADNSEYNVSVYGLGTDEFTALAEKHNSETLVVEHYYFDKDVFYNVQEEKNIFSTPYLRISDDIDPLREVTGLNLFNINLDEVKNAIENSKCVTHGEEENCQYIKFLMTSENAAKILGDSYHVFNEMENFEGSMYFYIGQDGNLTKFGYDSSYSENDGGQKTAVDLYVEYKISNINQTSKHTIPEWVVNLEPDAFDTVFYTKNNVDYSFIYEKSEKGSGYGYKLYGIKDKNDESALVKYAEIPEKIFGAFVTDIDRAIFVSSKGVEVLVMPEAIDYVPYAANGVNMTVFAKCEQFKEAVPDEVKAYTAQQWEFVNGVPTVK